MAGGVDDRQPGMDGLADCPAEAGWFKGGRAERRSVPRGMMPNGFDLIGSHSGFGLDRKVLEGPHDNISLGTVLALMRGAQINAEKFPRKNHLVIVADTPAALNYRVMLNHEIRQVLYESRRLREGIVGESEIERTWVHDWTIDHADTVMGERKKPAQAVGIWAEEMARDRAAHTKRSFEVICSKCGLQNMEVMTFSELLASLGTNEQEQQSFDVIFGAFRQFFKSNLQWRDRLKNLIPKGVLNAAPDRAGELLDYNIFMFASWIYLRKRGAMLVTTGRDQQYFTFLDNMFADPSFKTYIDESLKSGALPNDFGNVFVTPEMRTSFDGDRDVDSDVLHLPYNIDGRDTVLVTDSVERIHGRLGLVLQGAGVRVDPNLLRYATLYLDKIALKALNTLEALRKGGGELVQREYSGPSRADDILRDVWGEIIGPVQAGLRKEGLFGLQ